MHERHSGTSDGWKLFSDTTGSDTDTIHVRKIPMGYRLSLPLGHTLSLSARELLFVYGWCLQHITELEREAKRVERAETEILEGRDSHLPE